MGPDHRQAYGLMTDPATREQWARGVASVIGPNGVNLPHDVDLVRGMVDEAWEEGHVTSAAFWGGVLAALVRNG